MKIRNKDIQYIINESIKKIVNELNAYHGSAALFTNFDTKFMGSGEGAQQYGWGVYITDSEDTAEYYSQEAMNNNGANIGYKYQVQIPDDNGRNYIDWENCDIRVIGNALLPYIVNAFKAYYPNYPQNKLTEFAQSTLFDGVGNSLRAMFNNFMAEGIDAKYISQSLAQCGYTGFKVPKDFIHGGTGAQNGYNYVIFNPNDVKIISTNQTQRDTQNYSF